VAVGEETDWSGGVSGRARLNGGRRFSSGGAVGLYCRRGPALACCPGGAGKGRGALSCKGRTGGGRARGKVATWGSRGGGGGGCVLGGLTEGGKKVGRKRRKEKEK
jgi:hypothetical protein